MKSRGNRTAGVRAAVVALFAAMLMALAIAPGANAAKVDNPSPPNFRAEISGGFLEVVGTTGTALGIPFDFAQFELPNPAFAGTVTTNSNGYGVINIPNTTYANCVAAQTPVNGGICFPPIPVNIDDIAVTIRIQPVTAFTGLIDPLTGTVSLNLPLRLKVEGAALGIGLGDSCYIGSAGSPITLAMKTHVGAFPTVPQPPAQPLAVADFTADNAGWISAQAYTDEAGTWPAAPVQVDGFPVGGATKPTAGQIFVDPLTGFIPRAAGSFRAVDETLIARAAEGCGLATSTLNDQVGLPSSGNNTAAIDFRFATSPARPDPANAIVNKAVKSRFVAPGISQSPWLNTQKPTAVSAQSVTINASTSSFKVGGHPSERYQFDFGTGTFGAWTTNPVATFTAPTISEGSPPDDLDIRVKVKDTENDTDTSTRTITVVPATDISVDTSVSSVAGTKFRGGSAGEIDLDVKNNSTNDASSLPLQLTASVPTGVTITGFNGPPAWTCNNTATTVDCSLPQAQLAAGGTSHFDVAVDVAANAPTPALVNANVAMAGDPSPGNNTDNISVDVVKTDLTVDLTRPQDLVANGWFPFEIDVDNVGDGLTVGNTTVDVALPSDFTFRTQSSGGTGWSCSAPSNPQNVACVRTTSIAGNASAEPLTVWARVDRNTPAENRTVTATVTTQGDIGAFGGSDTDSDTSLIQVLPDLAVDAAVTGNYVVGDPGTVTYSATNESVVSINGPTTITSALPAGLTVSAVAGAGWDCSATTLDSDQISCVLAAGLNGGETSSAIEATLDVAQDAHPGVLIPAEVANTEDAFVPNDADSAEVEVRRLDVSIQKLAVRPFNVGIEGRYRLNVTNIGEAPTVGDITVIDELPLGLTLNGASGAGWDCSDSQVGQRDIECVLTSILGPGVSAAPIEARVTVLDAAAEAGTVTNTAYVDTERDDRGVAEDQAITANNSSTIATPAVAVDLSIESTHQGAFRVGTNDLYSLTVRNVGFFGTDPGESITVTSDLPEGIEPLTDDIEITRPGWACGEDEGDVVCVLEAADEFTSAMAPESAVTIDIPVHITDAAADTSANVAEVSTARDSNPDLSPNNIANDPTTVTRIDLELSGSVSIQPRAAGIGQVTLGLDNIGSAATVEPSIVTVPLATGTSYRATGSTTAGWTCSSPGAATQISCVRTQSIPAGGTAPELKLRTNVGATAPADWTTEADVATNGEPAERLANNEISLDQTLETIDLEISKGHDPAAVKAGKRASTKTYVENVGNTATAATIRVEETVHPSFQNVTASGTGWTCTVTGNDVVCTRTASLQPGFQAGAITVGFDIPGDQAGTRNATATVSSTDDPFTSNNSDTDPVQIVASADVAVEIDQPESMRVGDTVDVTYRVRNIGTDSTSGAPSVKLKIYSSEGLEPIQGTSGGPWDCEAVQASGNDPAVMTCDLAEDLEPGGDTVLTGEFAVTSTEETELSTLAVVSTAGELNRSNNADQAFSSISGVDLEATVAAPIDFLTDGTTTNRIVNIENVGTSPTTGPINVTVPLPTGVQWDTAITIGTGWDCNLQGGSVKCLNSDQVAASASLTPLTIGLRPSRVNAPATQITYTVSTQADENPANDSVQRTDEVRYNPDTTITAGPPATTESRSASVSFSSDDETATFECRVDAGTFEACTSPFSASGLSIGQHTIGVRAVNQYAMADPSPAVASWSITSTPPEGPFKGIKGTLTGGELSLASLGAVELPAGQITLDGSYYDNGALVIPKEGVKFETVVQTIEDVLGPGTVVTVEISISATDSGVGTLPKGGGPASFTLPVRADVQAKLGSLSLIAPGTECALKPVTFDLAGTYDEAGKSVSLSSPSVGFPEITGCDTFKTTIDTLLELPRSDIAIAMDFDLVEEVQVCPEGQTGTFPDCVTPPPPGNVILGKPKVKAPKKVKSGKPVTITARVANTGDAAASNVKVCLTLKKAKKLAKGKAKRCKVVKTIAAGGTGIAKFKVKTKKIKAKKAKLNYSVAASAAGVTKPKQYTGHVTLNR